MRERSPLTVPALVLLAACASSEAPRRPIDGEAWRHDVAQLGTLRASFPTKPFTVNVRAMMREPRSGRAFEGRGAIAIDPMRAMRMIIVGPGGATAMDAWVSEDRWRFSVPPASIVARGKGSAPPQLPIAFFRAWLIRPLAGRLLTMDGDRFVLRDGDATSTVLAKQTIAVDVRHGPSVDHVLWDHPDLTPSPGRATYRSSAGIEVTIDVESARFDAEAEAFVDPDP